MRNSNKHSSRQAHTTSALPRRQHNLRTRTPPHIYSSNTSSRLRNTHLHNDRRMTLLPSIADPYHIILEITACP